MTPEPRVCESQERLWQLDEVKRLAWTCKAYASGRRSSDILETLALAKAYADMAGQKVQCPATWHRTAWDRELDGLVRRLLGDQRCCDCGTFYSTDRLDGTWWYNGEAEKVWHCPKCLGRVSEPIGGSVDHEFQVGGNEKTKGGTTMGTYDASGYDQDGFNHMGRDKNGRDREDYDGDGRNRRGFDREGFNLDGFDQGHRDREGYDAEGFSQGGLDRRGFDRSGRDSNGNYPGDNGNYPGDYDGNDD